MKNNAQTQRYNLDDGTWEDTEWLDVKKGDIFRVLEEDGTMRMIRTDINYLFDGTPFSWRETAIQRATTDFMQDMYGETFICGEAIHSFRDLQEEEKEDAIRTI